MGPMLSRCAYWLDIEVNYVTTMSSFVYWLGIMGPCVFIDPRDCMSMDFNQTNLIISKLACNFRKTCFYKAETNHVLMINTLSD